MGGCKFLFQETNSHEDTLMNSVHSQLLDGHEISLTNSKVDCLPSTQVHITIVFDKPPYALNLKVTVHDTFQI